MSITHKLWRIANKYFIANKSVLRVRAEIPSGPAAALESSLSIAFSNKCVREIKLFQGNIKNKKISGKKKNNSK